MSSRLVVLVEWLDSSGPGGEERWHSMSSLGACRTVTSAVAVGIVMHESDEAIMLAGWADTEEWTDGDVLMGGVITIPQCCIQRRHEMGEVTFTRRGRP